jgi:hypothetical protein
MNLHHCFHQSLTLPDSVTCWGAGGCQLPTLLYHKQQQQQQALKEKLSHQSMLGCGMFIKDSAAKSTSQVVAHETLLLPNSCIPGLGSMLSLQGCRRVCRGNTELGQCEMHFGSLPRRCKSRQALWHAFTASQGSGCTAAFTKNTFRSSCLSGRSVINQHHRRTLAAVAEGMVPSACIGKTPPPQCQCLP